MSATRSHPAARHRTVEAASPVLTVVLLLRHVVLPWATLAAVGVLAALVGLVVWSLLPLLLGWQASVVMSGSMRPAIDEGDVVLTQPVGDVRPRPGLVVLFPDPAVAGRTVLHRVVDVDATGLLTTRGDANRAPDTTPVHPSDVHGLARLRIPWVGSLLMWQRTGRHVELVAGLLILVVLAAAAGRPLPDTAGPDARHRGPVTVRG